MDTSLVFVKGSKQIFSVCINILKAPTLEFPD